MNAQKSKYGNWVSWKLIITPAFLGLIFTGLAFLIPILGILAVISWLICVYFGLARYRFSPAGGDIQSKIIDLILDHVDWSGDGKIIDIGCGNGPLTIRLAKRYPQATILGIDYWGKNWDYGQAVCKQNARLEGVADQTSFQKSSASALPCKDCEFDLAVSNLTFHEVSDTKDKREVLKEAFRVVKPGGKFVFQDLFTWETLYGTPEELIRLIKSWGIHKVDFIRTCDVPFIPSFLKLPFMVGKIGIVCGEK
jgi:SAM-dependent methyltransferase